MVERIGLTIPLDEGAAVSGLWQKPPDAWAALALAHGAGAGMAHKAMTAIAEGLGERGIATLRYNFLYMERGSKRPDPPALCHGVVRAAVTHMQVLARGLPMFAGGKSFGGRMSSQAQALSPLPGVAGLVFFAFPLHPAGKPSDARADHLAQVKTLMLLVQGSRDELANAELLAAVVAKLGARASLARIEHADHGFRAPAKSGRSEAQILKEVLDIACDWMLARAKD